MKITALTVSNFKKIKDIKIEPDADRTLVLIGGKNAQGKSSTLDAITAAFGGKAESPVDPVRHGAESAEIEITTDAGLIIKRTFKPDGSTKLTVTTEHGAVKAPDAVLSKIIGSRFLDPLAFLAMRPDHQREFLLSLIGCAEDVAALDARHASAYATRTDVNREIKRDEAALASLPTLEAASEVDIVAIMESAELARKVIESFAVAERVHKVLLDRIGNGEAKHRELNNKIEELEDRLNQAQEQRQQTIKGIATLTDESIKTLAQLNAQQSKLAEAKEVEFNAQMQLTNAIHQNKLAADYAINQQRANQLCASIEDQRKKSAKLTDFMGAIAAKKTSLLVDSKIKIKGFDVETLQLGSVPLGQASAAERYRLAVQLALASAPQLQDVWIKDGALLDDDSQAALLAACEAAGVRLWLEIVGTGSGQAIVIHDGLIADQLAQVARPSKPSKKAKS
jgi:DNA repair exonuclease SbcCD ATPase subunit